MEIYISINGVIRNIIQKFNHHYNDSFILSELDEDNTFDYGIVEPITNSNLQEHYKFQSTEEFQYFFYVEYVLEIFGHAGLSYATTITELNNLIKINPEHTFTLIGLDELGKARPATLFFLSKNGVMCDNIRFIKESDIKNEWEKCDYWITDDKKIIDKCPEEKTVIKFNTPFNQYFTNKNEISKLNEIKEPWLKSLENITLLISTESQKSAESTAE